MWRFTPDHARLFWNISVGTHQYPALVERLPVQSASCLPVDKITSCVCCSTMRYKTLNAQTYYAHYNHHPASCLIIIIYIYHALVNTLSAHMIHINLNMIFCTHVEHSPPKTIYIKYYTEHTHTHTHTRTTYIIPPTLYFLASNHTLRWKMMTPVERMSSSMPMRWGSWESMMTP